MNDFLSRLFSLKDKINYRGWLVIPPAQNGQLVLLVEWFIDDKKYCYRHEYWLGEIDKANADLIEIFIDEANREIDALILSGK